MFSNFSLDFCVFGSTDVGDDETKQDVLRGERADDKKKDNLNNTKDGEDNGKRNPMKNSVVQENAQRRWRLVKNVLVAFKTEDGVWMERKKC